MFDAALSVIGLTQPPDARVMWIRDTLHLAEVECSAAYWAEAQGRSDLTVLTEPRELGFDDKFIRTWEYYLCVCEAGFLTRNTIDLEIVMEKPTGRAVPFGTS